MRKLAAIQFVNGLFLIALHMLSHPFYAEDETRRFTGGFISGKKTVIVLMVLFYWVTGITGIVWARPIKSRCSICYLITVIVISSAFSIALITNSAIGFEHLKACSTENSSIAISSKTLKTTIEPMNEYNCTSIISGLTESNMFRVSTERKILACQITLSSVYLLLKGTLLIYLFRKFEKVHLEVNQSDALMSRSTNLSSHSSVQEIVSSCCLCCILNIWSVSCECNETDKRSSKQSFSMTSPSLFSGKSYLNQ